MSLVNSILKDDIYNNEKGCILLINDYQWASVSIHTPQRHEHHYGNDLEYIYRIYDEANKEVKDWFIDRVNLRLYNSEHKMLEYIEGLKAFYDLEGIEAPFIQKNRVIGSEAM